MQVPDAAISSFSLSRFRSGHDMLVASNVTSASAVCSSSINAAHENFDHSGKSRAIPVRHDLQDTIAAYIDAAGLRDAPKDIPLFRSALRRWRRLIGKAINANDICRTMKRRLRDFGMPLLYSPHSFRFTTLADLFEQGVPSEDVQHLAGHADPPDDALYDRRERKIKRNIVERIPYEKGKVPQREMDL